MEGRIVVWRCTGCKNKIWKFCLVTTAWKEKQKTIAHDENLDRIKAQAESFNIPVRFIETDFATYTTDFVKILTDIKRIFYIDGVAFGDIYLEGHREWGEQVAEAAELKALYPYGRRKRMHLIYCRNLYHWILRQRSFE